MIKSSTPGSTVVALIALFGLGAYSYFEAGPNSAEFLPTLLGLFLFALLFIVERWQRHSRALSSLFLAVEALIVLAILVVQQADVPFAMLFFMLSAQTVSAFQDNRGFIWIGGYILASGAVMLYFSGMPFGLLQTILFGAGYFFFGVFAMAWARADATSRHNQELLEQLEEAHRQLREQAVCDPLTGLFNRRYLEETLDRELARARRHDFPVGMLLLDIDHFKLLNDQHGHQAGDQVLRELGKSLAACCREEDIACRYGGEEFLVLLPGIPMDLLLQRAEQIRKNVSFLRIPWEGEVLQITVSLGAAEFPRDADTGHELVRSADTALYQAKKTGRNRVVAFLPALSG